MILSQLPTVPSGETPGTPSVPPHRSHLVEPGNLGWRALPIYWMVITIDGFRMEREGEGREGRWGVMRIVGVNIIM